MSRPKALDLFCCGGGSAMGYSRAGFEVYGIDNDPKRLRDFPFPWLVMDAIEALGRLIAGEGLTFSNGETLYLKDFAFIHASPPCQGYSIMNNLPWIRSRTYPLLILPVRELLDETGLPYCIENVAGAASKKNLEKLGLLEHRLRAGWLCGGMFGLPIYRHRYFETNWFWIQPGHPKHQRTRQPESAFSPRPLGVWEQTYEAENPGRSAQAARVNTGWRAGHDGQGAIVASPYGASLTPGQRGIHKPEDVKEKRRGQTASPPMAGHSPGSAPSLGNGAQKEGVADGHAAGWKVAAEAMGIDWMKRSELTQAIPPVMTEYLWYVATPCATLFVCRKEQLMDAFNPSLCRSVSGRKSSAVMTTNAGCGRVHSRRVATLTFNYHAVILAAAIASLMSSPMGRSLTAWLSIIFAAIAGVLIRDTSKPSQMTRTLAGV